MTAEEALVTVVAEWARGEAPCDPGAAGHAVAIVVDCYRSGRSVNEACEAARAFVGSWTRHPAHPRAAARMSLELAS